ncbi:MAG: TolC family protein [Xanthomonadaceae bacterium]|nr:TolC family protein [Xanthomonadaceae bacterium]MDE1961490.1 TolC family protein [Xanthomonadaceae bacterium]MDE2084464.1 TolC family protein [Xanthomonadaceae bacterium]MDE2258592.1 TolC family protein [Xanthomonadaceae bacterium]
MAPLSLDAAARLAAAQAPQVQAQRLRAQAAHDDAVRAGQLPDPKLVVGIDNLTATGAQAFDAAADSMTMRTVGVMQEIPARAKRKAESAVAGADMRIADADAVAIRLATRRTAADAWVALWAALRERALLTDLRTQSGLAAAASKAKLRGGTGDATDALATRAAAAELDNKIDAADTDVAAARAVLARWIDNRAAGALAPPPDFSALPVPPAQLLGNPDRQGPLLGWSAREDRAQARIDLAKAGKRPDWSISLNYGERIHSPDMVSVMVGFSLPLFPGNRQDRDISARYAERDAVLAEHEDARRAQSEAVASTLAVWQGDGRQVRRYRDELLPLAEDRARTALAAYRSGASLQPWLDARRDEIDVRVAYARALADWGRAWVSLAYLVPDSGSTAEIPR